MRERCAIKRLFHWVDDVLRILHNSEIGTIDAFNRDDQKIGKRKELIYANY